MPELTRRPYFPVGGTNDWKPRSGLSSWLRPDGAMSKFMWTEGFDNIRPNYPLWDTGLGGFWPGEKMRRWEFGAINIAKELEQIPLEDRHVMSLSHGLQPTMIACANGLKLQSFVSIAGPVRNDMKAYYEAGLKNVEVYTCVFSDSLWRDRWQILGTIRDGTMRYTRKMPGAHCIGIPKVGHSELVRRAEYRPLLRSHGVLDRL